MALTAIFLAIVPLIFLVLAALGVWWLVKGGHRITAVGVRELFQLTIQYGLIVAVALGAADLLARGIGWREEPEDGLAQSLAFVGVGLPLLALSVWAVRRWVRDREASAIYAGYLTVTSLTALLAGTGALMGLLGSALVGRFAQHDLASVLVWGTVWWLQWRAASSLAQQLNVPHLLLGSTIGGVYAVSGFTATLSSSASALLIADQVIGPAGGIAASVGILLTGATVFFRYWVKGAQHLPRSPLWLLAVVVLGSAGGLILFLSAGGTALWKVLVWLVGEPGAQSANAYFAHLAGPGAAALAGVLAWWYFRQMLDGARTTARAGQTYLYLLSGISLAGAAVGVAVTVAAFFQSLVPTFTIGTSPINPLLAGLTLVAVSGGAWHLFWRQAQAQPRNSARRMYLLIVIWAAVAVGVAALLGVAGVVFQAVFGEQSDFNLLWDVRNSAGALAAAVAVIAYHLILYRNVPSEGVGPTSVRRPRTITFAGPAEQLPPGAGDMLGPRLRTGAIAVSLPDDPAALEALLAEHADTDLILLPATGHQAGRGKGSGQAADMEP